MQERAIGPSWFSPDTKLGRKALGALKEMGASP